MQFAFQLIEPDLHNRKLNHILDLTLAGAVGGLNRMFCAQTRRTAAAAVENRFHFVENGRPE